MSDLDVILGEISRHRVETAGQLSEIRAQTSHIPAIEQHLATLNGRMTKHEVRMDTAEADAEIADNASRERDALLTRQIKDIEVADANRRLVASTRSDERQRWFRAITWLATNEPIGAISRLLILAGAAFGAIVAWQTGS